MTTRTVRFKVRLGHLEPLEPVELVEGSEVEANVQIAEVATAQAKPSIALDTWDLGPMGPLTREQIYEDVG